MNTDNVTEMICNREKVNHNLRHIKDFAGIFPENVSYLIVIE